MTEWGVVGVIIALVGLFFTVTKPIIELNKTITRMDAKLENVSATQETYESSNTKNHSRIWDKISEQDKLLDNHAIRLHDLDGK